MNMIRSLLALLAVAFSLFTLLPTAQSQAASATSSGRVYFGTYTSGKSEGIYVSEFSADTGKATPPRLAAAMKNPSFLALHPQGQYLYAVGEVSGPNRGGVTAFRIDASTGLLSEINQQPSGGDGPCHVNVDARGHFVLVANYGGGSIAVFPIGDQGRLVETSAFIQHEGSSVNPQRQKGPHAHGIYPDPANRFIFVPDLGLDRVMIYRFDSEKGKLQAAAPPSIALAPGAGPRHFAFHPNGRWAYVINELDSTITRLHCDSQTGRLTPAETVSTLPADFTGRNSTAEIVVHPSGRFLYGSNRGHDTIAIFEVDPDSGKLQPRGHAPTGGKVPRNFGIDPTGRWLLAANQASDNVVVFRIEVQTGSLTPTGQVLEIGAPVCVLFAPIP